MKIQYTSPFPWCPFLVYDNTHKKVIREAGTDTQPHLILDSGEDIPGEIAMARKAAEEDKTLILEGKDAEIIRKWVDFAEKYLHHTSSVNQDDFLKATATLNSYLRLRTTFVSYNRTLADIVVWGCLKNNEKWASLDKATVPYLNRWFVFCEESNSFRTVAALSRAKIPPAKADSGKAKEDKQKPKGEKKPAAAVAKSATEKVPENTAAPGPEPAIPVADPAKRLTMPNPCNNTLIRTSPNLPDVKAHFDIELPNAEIGKVVTRFPPEASGYLHVGHIKAAMLNEYYALNYKGKLLLRFDDTNPAKERGEFEDAIVEDLKTVGIVPYRLTYTSDYFELIFHCGTRMLEMGKAYIDNLPVDIMRENRMNGIDSPNRTNSVEENLRLWEEMKRATEEGKKCVMRAKIDMQATNTAMRDPALFRVVDLPHARTGDRFKVYPLYDFACPIVDSIEGVSVSMRTIEYRNRNEQYHWIQNALGLREVPIYDFARLNFKFTEMSKRKLQWFVDNGYAEGWFDPRFPTVQGMMRRGLTIPALRAFILEQGPSRNITYQEWDKIWAKNKQVIDPIAPRYTAIETRLPVLLTLVDGPKAPYNAVVPRHRKNPDVGDKLFEFSSQLLIEQCDAELLKEGDEVTLMGWGNIIIEKVEKDSTRMIPSTAQFSKGAKSGKSAEPTMVPTITHVFAHMHLDGDFKKTKLKLTWLSCASTGVSEPYHLPTCKLVAFDHLLTVDKVEEGPEGDSSTPKKDFTYYANKNSKFETDVYVEPAAISGVHGDIVQFERKGFFYLDQPFVPATDSTPASQAVFHFIPDGRTMLMRIAGVLPQSVQDSLPDKK